MYVIAVFSDNPNGAAEAEPLGFVFDEEIITSEYDEARRFRDVATAFLAIERMSFFVKAMHLRVYHVDAVPPWWGSDAGPCDKPKN